MCLVGGGSRTHLLLYLCPRWLTIVVERFQFLLVLAGVHGFPESVVLVGVQHALMREVRKDLDLEVLSFPQVKCRLFEYEETGVNPVVPEDRLLAKFPDLAVTVKHHRTVLRAQWDGSHSCKRAGLAMGSGQFMQINMPQAGSVSDEKSAPDVRSAAADAFASVAPAP